MPVKADLFPITAYKFFIHYLFTDYTHVFFYLVISREMKINQFTVTARHAAFNSLYISHSLPGGGACRIESFPNLHIRKIFTEKCTKKFMNKK